MTSPMDPIEILSQIYAAQGYIVVCFDQPVDIGFTWPELKIRNGPAIPQPMRVSAPSDRAEYLSQFSHLNRPVIPYTNHNYKFFYR